MGKGNKKNKKDGNENKPPADKENKDGSRPSEASGSGTGSGSAGQGKNNERKNQPQQPLEQQKQQPKEQQQHQQQRQQQEKQQKQGPQQQQQGDRRQQQPSDMSRPQEQQGRSQQQQGTQKQQWRQQQQQQDQQRSQQQAPQQQQRDRQQQQQGQQDRSQQQQRRRQQHQDQQRSQQQGPQQQRQQDGQQQQSPQWPRPQEQQQRSQQQGPQQQQPPQWPRQQGQQDRPMQQQQSPQWPRQQGQQDRPPQQQQSPQWPRQQGQQDRPPQQQSSQWPRQQGQQDRPPQQQSSQWPRQQGQQDRPQQQQSSQWPRQQGQQDRPQQQQQRPQYQQHGQQRQPQQQYQSRGPGDQKEKQFEVETNYVTLDLSKMPKVAYHYDVQIDPDRPAKFQRPAFFAFVQKKIPQFRNIAFDGKHNAYSVDKLPDDILEKETEVTVVKGDRKIPFKVTMKATDDIEVDLSSLRTYQKERIFDKPMRALQCIDVVLSSPCYEHDTAVRAGRSFYMRPINDYIDLGDGFELWYGLFQAAMLCSTPLMNIDICHKSFPSEINIVDFYSRCRHPNDFENFLKGLRVVYTPPANFKSTPKEYKFIAVMRSSKDETFKTDDGKVLTIADYYKSKGYALRRPELPCLHVGSTVRKILIPLEFISVPSGQAILRKDTENQVRVMCEKAATASDIRKQKILSLLNEFRHNANPTVQRFGISIGNQFIRVEAKLLVPPAIIYKSGKMQIQFPGEWRMDRGAQFFEGLQQGKAPHQWAIISLNPRDINRMYLEQHFIPLVVSQSRSLGMSLASSCASILEEQRPQNIKQRLQELKSKKVDIVFVVLPLNENYAMVKQEAELSCGIVTQCIKSRTMRGFRAGQVMPINAMTVGNILLKVNTKLNGINHKIDEPNNQINFNKSKIMFVGADVSHPSPTQRNLPSIVGVVASHDLFGTRYNMQYRLQKLGEKIEDMNNIFKYHLGMFKRHNNCYPDHVIYYRDGVGDGDFPAIESYEMGAMRAACKGVGCQPKFTCIVVVKRHHTRFFPFQSDAEGKYKNVKAGTVVDKTIIHPNEKQFFMVSHKSIKGTARPTRYNVIVDDANIDLNILQKLTYNMCHLFPRCNRSVSYPAPAYLAHLVGKRGRAYVEGRNLNLNDLKTEYSRRIVSPEIMDQNPMYFV